MVEQYSPPGVPDSAPLIDLRERLEAARETGEGFGAAWVRCSTDVLATIADHKDRSSWRTALERTRTGWQRAYERQPAAEVDRQLTLVGAERGVPDLRECVWCGADIERRHPWAKFCSDRHKRAHHHASAPSRAA